MCQKDKNKKTKPPVNTGLISIYKGFPLVEARGVEPLSEKHSYTLSPGADGF